MIRDSLLALLTGDTTLMASLTGGVHTATEISRQNTSAAFDATTRELKPCGLLRMETQSPSGPHINGARQFFAVYLYQLSGFATIDAAANRLFALLNQTSLAAEGVYEMAHIDDSVDLFDDGLAASLRICRYEAVRLRA